MLYFVSTPIGNLKDITLRALEVLRSVDLILCEDTRVTQKLLLAHEISCPLVSFHAHNEHRRLTEIVQRLQNDENIACVTDAGSPGLSDPGYLLARACVRESIEYTVLPGANALLPALLLSGFAMDRFYFEGFLPQKKGRLKTWQRLLTIDTAIVLYESPYRIVKCLEEIDQHFGDTRKVALVREISKKFESCYRGTSRELLENLDTIKIKGEFVVVLSRPIE